MKIKEIFPKVYLCLFKDAYQLCMSFVRMQEFYESPKYRGKAFTLEEFMEWWSKEYGDGIFTYTGEWDGFNVPGKIIWKWMEKIECNFTGPENILLNKLEDELYKNKQDIQNIYLIGAHEACGKRELKKVICHEFSHALYYLDKQYRKSCIELMKVTDPKIIDAKSKLLLSIGYCKSVINDEIQAYFSTEGTEDDGHAIFADNFSKYIRRIKWKCIT